MTIKYQEDTHDPRDPRRVPLVCSICQRDFKEWGNNAQPVNDGQCCNDCNAHVVIPARIAEMRRYKAAN